MNILTITNTIIITIFLYSLIFPFVNDYFPYYVYIIWGIIYSILDIITFIANKNLCFLTPISYILYKPKFIGKYYGYELYYTQNKILTHFYYKRFFWLCYIDSFEHEYVDITKVINRLEQINPKLKVKEFLNKINLDVKL